MKEIKPNMYFIEKREHNDNGNDIYEVIFESKCLKTVLKEWEEKYADKKVPFVNFYLRHSFERKIVVVDFETLKEM